MKAIRFHEFGGPEVLKYEDLPEPRLHQDQVLVHVKACALNHIDVWTRKGVGNVTLPHINGADVAGEVVEVGEQVPDIVPGQRVLLAPMYFCGNCQFCVAGLQNMCRQFTVLGNGVDGGNCEYIAVPRVNVIPIPATQKGSELTYTQAASVPLVFLTAWHMLVGRCQIKPGNIVLVLGAGSGVGIAAIQIAKMHGAEVIATAGSDEKLERARELGADHTIHHYNQKISDEVKRITAKAGVDIVFEHVGAATFEESIRSLRYGGKLVTCGATSGPEAKFDIRQLFAKQLSFLGSYMGTMGEFHEVLKHVFSGELKPVVDKIYPLSEAREAHERLENSQQFGKIVLAT
jgi:NADPH:quinone reductase-like Zn-dependent oxidoreductase